MSKQSRNGKKIRTQLQDVEGLYLELLQRYYEEVDREQAAIVAEKLEQQLQASPIAAYSIRGEEVRSIIAELREDYRAAIESREAEIRKILELHTAALGSNNWAYVSRIYDHRDVSDRLDLLAMLYDKQGDLERAIAVLLESKDYCKSHQVKFDGQKALTELEAARDEQLAR